MKAKDRAEVILPKDIFVGNPNAPVMLMEFGEYENEDCAKANEVVKKLLQTFEGKIKFQFRHFPLNNIHQRSMKAAEAAIAAAQTGKFWEMHNVMFDNRRQLGVASLKLYSKEAGVEDKLFLSDLINSTYGWHVHSDFNEGVHKGVNSIPAFFVNGEMVKGKPTFENLSKYITLALKKSKKKTAVKQRA